MTPLNMNATSPQQPYALSSSPDFEPSSHRFSSNTSFGSSGILSHDNAPSISPSHSRTLSSSNNRPSSASGFPSSFASSPSTSPQYQRSTATPPPSFPSLRTASSYNAPSTSTYQPSMRATAASTASAQQPDNKPKTDSGHSFLISLQQQQQPKLFNSRPSSPTTYGTSPHHRSLNASQPNSRVGTPSDSFFHSRDVSPSPSNASAPWNEDDDDLEEYDERWDNLDDEDAAFNQAGTLIPLSRTENMGAGFHKDEPPKHVFPSDSIDSPLYLPSLPTFPTHDRSGMRYSIQVPTCSLYLLFVC